MESTKDIFNLFKRYSIVVNFSPLIKITRNGTLVMNIMSVDTSNYLCDSMIFHGTSAQSVKMLSGLSLTNFTYTQMTLRPKTNLAIFTSSKITGKFKIIFERTIIPKLLSDGNPSRCIDCSASQSSSYLRCLNTLQFSETVLIKGTLFSHYAALKQYILLGIG